MTYSRAALFLASRIQSPNYSSGPRPDGYQYPEISEAQAATLRRILCRPEEAARPVDPYGIQYAREWRERAYKGRGENTQQNANGKAGKP